MLRRLILVTTLMALSSATAYAEWREVGSNQGNGGFTVYANPDTIRRKGNVVKGWEMYNYKTARSFRGTSYSSTKQLNEYECVEERRRMLAFTDFTGSMGDGSAVYTDTEEGKWSPVEPDSVGHAMWKHACGKP